MDCGLDLTDTQFAHGEDVHTGKMHNSLLWFWWLILWWRRKIPAGSNIHTSVQQRMEAVNGYRPGNLPRDANYVS